MTVVLHFEIDSKISLRDNRTTPTSISKLLAEEVEMLQVVRLISFTLGIALLIITIILVNRSNDKDKVVHANESELLDDEIIE